MLSPIAQEVSIPEELAIAYGETTYTVTAAMQKAGARMIENLPAPSAQAATEINIFKPNRKETLIEASETGPNFTSYGQAGARWLVNLLRLGVVEIQATVIAIQRVGRRQTVEQQDLRCHRQRGWEPAHAKAAIYFTALVRQRAADGADALLIQSFGKRIERAGLSDGVWIQKKEDAAGCQTRTLIGGSGKANVFWILNDIDRGISVPGLFNGVVLG